MIKSLLLILMLGFAGNLYATEYSNSFLKFQIPDNWQCNLTSTVFICHSFGNLDAKKAVIVFTAKLKGPQDSLADYLQHLSSPLPSADPRQHVTSRIISPPKEYLINGRTWVDAIHSSSELKGYFTRYLGTVTDRLAVMVSLSVRSSDYASIGPTIFKIADSLMLSEKYKSSLGKTSVPSSSVGFNGTLPRETMGTDNGSFFIAPYQGPKHGTSRATKWKALLFLFGVVSAIVAGYFLWTSRK